MAISVALGTVASGSFGGGSGNVSVSPPAGLTAGDAWVIQVWIDSGGSSSINTPSGFTAMHAQVTSSGGFPEYKAFFKEAGASESAVSVTTASGVYDMYCVPLRISGDIDASSLANFVGNVATFTPTGGGNSIDAPDITIQNNNSMALLTMGCNNAGNGNMTSPSGTTELYERKGAGVYPCLDTAYQAVNAGSYTPGTFDWQNSDTGRLAVTLEILPAAGGVTEQVPSGTLTLTGIAPKRIKRIYEKIPAHGT